LSVERFSFMAPLRIQPLHDACCESPVRFRHTTSNENGVRNNTVFAATFVGTFVGTFVDRHAA